MTRALLIAANIARLPEYCYAVVPEKRPGQRIVMIKAGESGHFVTDMDQPSLSAEQVQIIVIRLNARLAITPAQQEAMLAGSMFGWHVAGADCRRYAAH